LSWKTNGTFATLPWLPGFQTSAMALAIFWTLLIKKKEKSELLYFVMAI